MRFHAGMSPWEILGVPEGAALSAARGRWMKLVRETHPDATGVDSTEDCVLVNSAFAAVKEFWASPPADVEVPVDYSTAEPMFPLDDVLVAAAEEALDRLFGKPGEGLPVRDGDDFGLFDGDEEAVGEGEGSDLDDGWLDDFYSDTSAASSKRSRSGRGRGRGPEKTRPEDRTGVRLSGPVSKVGGARRRRNGADERIAATQREIHGNGTQKGSKGPGELRKVSRKGDETSKQADRPRRRRVAHGEASSSPTPHRASQLAEGDLDSTNADPDEHNFFGADGPVRPSSLDEARRSASGRQKRRTKRHADVSSGLPVGPVIAVAVIGTIARTVLQNTFEMFTQVPVVAVAAITVLAVGVVSSLTRRYVDETIIVIAAAAAAVLALVIAELVAISAIPVIAVIAVGFAWSRTRPDSNREVTQ